MSLSMTKQIMLYIRDEELRQEKGLPLATMARSLLIQKLKEIASIPAGKREMDAKDTPSMECHDD